MDDDTPATEARAPEARPAACAVCGGEHLRPRRVAWPVRVWACPACKSAFVWPLPEGSDLLERYEDEHARGKWEPYFDEGPPEGWGHRVGILGDALGGPGRVLDVGCGTGQFLAAALEGGWDAVGTELSVAPLAAAAERAPGATLLVGEMASFRDEPLFDAVTFWDVLEHVPHPVGLLDGARRRLRTAGVVAATLPNAWGTTAWLHGRRWKYYDFAEFGHIYHLSLGGLCELFQRAGLAVEVARTLGSTDLRHVREARGGAPHGPTVSRILDRTSGLLARVARPLGLGNTLLVVGRRP